MRDDPVSAAFAAETLDAVHVCEGHSFADAGTRRPNVIDDIVAQAKRQPDRPCLTALSGQGEETLSFGEVEAHSRLLAGWLRRDLGASPGMVIGLLPTSDAASALLLLGLLRTGAAALMLNPAEPAARLREQLAMVNAAGVLRTPASVPAGLDEAIASPVPEACAHVARGEMGISLRWNAPALIFGTSGSTASAKLVTQCHLNAAVNAEAVRRHHGLGEGDRFLGCLPLHHVNGVHFSLMATMAAGAHAIILDGFDPVTYLNAVRKCRPRVASVVPSLLEALLDLGRGVNIEGDLGYFVSAAAPLARRTAQAVATRMGVRVIQGYGLTETTNFSTTVPVDLSPAAYMRLIRDADIPSVGIALEGNEVSIRRGDGSRAATGEVGEICMRGHNVMLEYAGNLSATVEAFRGGWFHSGDLGVVTVDSESGREFITITGRIKNIAKVGGESVALEEIERALKACPAVGDVACVAIPHRLLGDEIVAAVVGNVTMEEVREALRDRFSSIAFPRRVVVLPMIPRTPTGKVLRAELARLLRPEQNRNVSIDSWTLQNDHDHDKSI